MIIALFLLATLLLIQAGMPLAFLVQLAHVQQLSTSTPKSLSTEQLFCPKPVLVHGIIVTQVQDPALHLIP